MTKHRSLHIGLNKVDPDGEATIGAVRAELDEAAAELEDGDFFFLTYSGHGGQIVDLSGDEPDSFDETWCLYDT